MHEAAPSGRSASGADDPGDLDSGFDYTVVRDAGDAVISLRGELDLASAPALSRELLAMLDQHLASLTLDLEGLTFLDSSGLGSLYRARQAAEERGVTLQLRAVPDHVMRVLDVTAMAPLFDLGARSR